MILVDTSVWVDHLRSGEPGLIALLERGAVGMHPLVIGELGCGNLKARGALVQLWRNLPRIAPVTDAEALYFLEQRQLMGKGIGFIDVHLLASVALQDGVSLWTRDKRLSAVAVLLELNVLEQ